MKKLNKKGFTLVELLAVIVILALLIVVVATTALPAMNNAKKNSLTVYAERLQEKAKERYISEMKSGTWAYSVKALTGETDKYSGIVVVGKDANSGAYTTTVYVMDTAEGFGLNGVSKFDKDLITTVTASGEFTPSGDTISVNGSTISLVDTEN